MNASAASIRWRRPASPSLQVPVGGQAGRAGQQVGLHPRRHALFALLAKQAGFSAPTPLLTLPRPPCPPAAHTATTPRTALAPPPPRWRGRARSRPGRLQRAAGSPAQQTKSPRLQRSHSIANGPAKKVRRVKGQAVGGAAAALCWLASSLLFLGPQGHHSAAHRPPRTWLSSSSLSSWAKRREEGWCSVAHSVRPPPASWRSTPSRCMLVVASSPLVGSS